MTESYWTSPITVMADFWNSRYGEEGFAYGMEANDFLAETLKDIGDIKGKNVLCIAEGEGRNAIHIAKLGAARVHAFDLSEVGMKKLKYFAMKENLQEVTNSSFSKHCKFNPFFLIDH